MTGPQRVRVEGDLYHGQVPLGAIYVGRPAPGLKGSPVANPFRPGRRVNDPATGCEVVVTDQAHAVALYATWLGNREAQVPDWAAKLRLALSGQDLACWCAPSDPCHVDPLLAFINVPIWVACGHRRNEANTFLIRVKKPGKVYRYEYCRECRNRTERYRRAGRSIRRRGTTS